MRPNIAGLGDKAPCRPRAPRRAPTVQHMPDGSSVPQPHPAVTVEAMRALLARLEYSSQESAASALDIEVKKIRGLLGRLDSALGNQLFEGAGRGQRPTALARQLGPKMTQVLRDIINLSNPAEIKPHTTIGFLPHHAEFMGGFIRDRDMDERVRVEVEVLEERHRATEVFQREAIDKLVHRELDLVVGPPPRKTGGILQAEELYRTHLVALVPAGSPDVFELSQSAGTRLLLPPEETRAGAAIQDALREVEVEPDIRQESFGTKVLVILAARSHGIAVVPGDIAFVFSPLGTLSGGDEMQETMKWVPVEKNGERIKHAVKATYLRDRDRPNEKVMRTIALLSQAVHARYRVDAGNEFVELSTLLTEEQLRQVWRPAGEPDRRKRLGLENGSNSTA